MIISERVEELMRNEWNIDNEGSPFTNVQLL